MSNIIALKTPSYPAIEPDSKVTFTIYNSSEPLSKRYWLEGDNIQKQASAQMYKGAAERVTMPFSDIPKALALATEKQAFGYGSHSLNYPDKVSIVVGGKEQSEKNIISRTKQFLAYQPAPGLLMLDYDPNLEYGFKATTEQLIKALIKIHPAIEQSARIVRGSVSAGVHKTGESPRTDKGFHIYIPVKNAADIPRYGALLFDRLWMYGLGFIALSANGSMLERSVIDGAVFSPERLDFVGKPIISGTGLSYTPPQAEYVDGVVLDTESLQDLTDDEKSTVQQLKDEERAAIKPEAAIKQGAWADSKIESMQAAGVPIEKARHIISQMLKGGCKDLYDDFILEFTTGMVSVADVLNNPQAFDGKSLADPIEGIGYGKTTAKFYWNDGKPVVNSLAHGQDTKYFLHVTTKAELIEDEESQYCEYGDTDIKKNHPEPIDTTSFPHLNYKGKPLSTHENLEHLINSYGIKCFYDEMLKKSFLVFPGEDGQRNDISENAKIQRLRSLVELNGMRESASEKLPVILMDNIVNPVIDFITQKQWDGVSRLDDLYNTITLSDIDEQYRSLIMRTWLIQCVAAADGAKSTPNIKARPKYELVFTLQGGQGAKKTSWFRSLLPEKYADYILDGINLDIDNKDSVKQAISGWIVELGELDSTFRKSDIAKLKAFLSNTVDSIRMPYDRVQSDFQRRASFCASVNEPDFLVDETGNRRYGALKVRTINPDHYIDMQQLWAEVWSMYLSGEQWWFDDASMDIVTSKNMAHMKINPIEDAIQSVFDLSVINGDAHLSCTEILVKCGVVLGKGNVNAVSNVLHRLGFTSKKVKGKPGFWMSPRNCTGIEF